VNSPTLSSIKLNQWLQSEIQLNLGELGRLLANEQANVYNRTARLHPDQTTMQ